MSLHKKENNRQQRQQRQQRHQKENNKEHRQQHDKERRAAVRLLVNFVKEHNLEENPEVKKAVNLLDRKKGRHPGPDRTEQFIALFENTNEVHEDIVFSVLKEGRSVVTRIMREAEKRDFIFDFDKETSLYALLSRGKYSN